MHFNPFTSINMPKNKIQPVILIILDGFGKGKKYKGNAVELAKTPFLDSLNKKFKMIGFTLLLY